MSNSSFQAEAESWARALYHNAVDQKDAAGFAAVFAEEGRLRFGNEPPIVGRQKIEEAITQFFLAMVDLHHEFTAISCDKNRWFLEAIVTYTRHDRGIVTVPAMTVFEMAQTNGQFVVQSCRIYVDLTPLFAP